MTQDSIKKVSPAVTAFFESYHKSCQIPKQSLQINKKK